jgi:hypothetical protein
LSVLARADHAQCSVARLGGLVDQPFRTLPTLPRDAAQLQDDLGRAPLLTLNVWRSGPSMVASLRSERASAPKAMVTDITAGMATGMAATRRTRDSFSKCSSDAPNKIFTDTRIRMSRSAETIKKFPICSTDS